MVKNNKATSIEKKLMVQTIMDSGQRALVFFDPRDENVEVPEVLKTKTKTALEFGYDMPTPIEDLVINDMGIGGLMLFGTVKYYCWVPWDKVFCIVITGTSLGTEWVEDIPEDDVVLQKAISDHAAKKVRKTFRVIENENEKEITPTEKNTDRSHLTLVK